jgi:hypothetical protein
MGSLTTPVLLIVFNRPDTTARVFQEIRRAGPPALYVAADGPRPGVAADTALCDAARRVVAEIDWPCDVRTLYRDENLGPKHAPASAITWFFDHEPEGIVLEHDCLPHPSFFRFSEELLARYRREPRVMMIGGWNPLGRWRDDRQSYHFSTGGPWGWASWRRAWTHYDVHMARWADEEARRALRAILRHPRQLRDDLRRFALTHAGRIQTWDYQWRFARLVNGGLTVTPSRNLVRNIGFRPDATTTRRSRSVFAHMPAYELEFPLRHPPAVELDQDFVARAYDFVHPRLPQRLWRRLAEVLTPGGRMTSGAASG